MIFDRTREHVLLSKDLIENKVKKFISLTDDEVEILERGTMTKNTINRIENAESNLVETIRQMGYYNNSIESKTNWETSDIFYSHDLKRIFNNAIILRDSFFVYESTPKTLVPKYSFENLNYLEENINDMIEMVDEISSLLSECGALECGG